MKYFLLKTPHNTIRIYLEASKPIHNCTHGVPGKTTHEKIEEVLDTLCIWGGTDHSLDHDDVIYHGREFPIDMGENLMVVILTKYPHLEEIQP